MNNFHINDQRLTEEQRFRIWEEAVKLLKADGVQEIDVKSFMNYISLVDIERIMKRYPSPIDVSSLKVKACNIKKHHPKYSEMKLDDIIYHPDFHKYNTRGKLL